MGVPIAVPANGSRAPVAPYPLAARRARAALREFRPDVAHLHEPLVPGPSWGVLADRARPIIGTFHRADAGVIYPVLRPLFSRAAARLALRVAVSSAAADTAERALGVALRPTMIIENAVDPGRDALVAPAMREGPTVVFLGRHESRKGLEIALRALALLPPEVRLWVIGEGPETARLKSRYPDRRISWLGALPNADAARFVKAADVLVAPSLGGESFGVVLLEAMAAGTAIVCSNLPGYREAGGDAARFVAAGIPGRARGGRRRAPGAPRAAR